MTAEENGSDSTAEAKDAAPAEKQSEGESAQPKSPPSAADPTPREQASVLDSLDLARGEVNDEDLQAIENALSNLDFATRKASPERIEQLDALSQRLADLIDQIRKGVRRQPPGDNTPLSEKEQARYQEWVDEGVAAGEGGDLEAATQSLEEAVRLDPDGIEGLFNLGVVYGLLAHKNIAKAEFYDNYVRDEVYMEKAQICYDRVLELSPDHLPSLNNLATLYSMRDYRDEAVALLRRIVGLKLEDEAAQQIVEDARSQLKELESI